MKKIFAIVLAVVMLMTMSVSAFAEAHTTLPATETMDVIVRLDSDGDTTPDEDDASPNDYQITVDVEWSADTMEFTYTNAWDEYALEYAGYWAGVDNYVKITNRSNVGVKCALDYTANTGYEDAVVSFAMGTEVVVNENGEPDENGEYPATTIDAYHMASFAENVLTLQYGHDETMDGADYPLAPYAKIAITMAETYVPDTDNVTVGKITITIAANVTTDSGSDDSSSDDTTVETVTALTMAGDGTQNTDYAFTVQRGTELTVNVSSTMYNAGDLTDKISSISLAGLTESDDYTWNNPILTITNETVETATLTVTIAGEPADTDNEGTPTYTFVATLTIVD
ncbi:MAG: hypothetical protein IJW40_11000 [Clostridia bacterium]|nr:hypothetical protein [Clostridia bacterium]